ncbi:MAG: glycoside hydrolase family 3 protein, partial [Gammaproteobacteria bacterium]|nr:glycoside hydrolase family 3 protein [Gammaproteobacteria bacterium]
MRQTQTTIIENRVIDLLTKMTLAEKIGQMTQVDVRGITAEELTRHSIGSVLSGGGANPTPNSPETWAKMARDCQAAALQSRLKTPIIYGVDAVHGHSNMKGAVIFPHNIGLGATRNPALVQNVGRITALETLATGVHWNFAPAVSVPLDIRWGRTYEGYSEDTALVSELGAAYLRGLQQVADESPLTHPHAVLGSVKHFVGDGGTTWGTHLRYDWLDWWQPHDDAWSIDQGDTVVDETTLRTVHLPPYQAAIAAGARNIMVSYSSWNGLKMHTHKYLLTDVLKGELGFSGFLVSDWLAVNQLDPDYTVAVVSAINAGLDMVMVPFEYQQFITAVTAAVENGKISLDRIDDAVSRILRVKFELGVFEQPFADESLLARVGSTEHRAVAREAVRQSLVLLKNDNNTLPLPKNVSRLLVAGQAANDIGLQCGGWSIEWQGQPGPITPGTTLLDAIKHTISEASHLHYDANGDFSADTGPAEVGLVVLSEQPYAEGEGDRADLHLPEADIALIERVRPHCQKLVVILYSGRPLIITDQLARCDAFVAAWLP